MGWWKVFDLEEINFFIFSSDLYLTKLLVCQTGVQCETEVFSTPSRGCKPWRCGRDALACCAQCDSSTCSWAMKQTLHCSGMNIFPCSVHTHSSQCTGEEINSYVKTMADAQWYTPCEAEGAWIFDSDITLFHESSSCYLDYERWIHKCHPSSGKAVAPN